MSRKMICIEPRGCLVNGKIYKKGDKAWDHEILRKGKPSKYFRPASAPKPLEERLQAMDKDGLEDFAKKEFGEDIDKRKNKPTIIKEILQMAKDKNATATEE